MVKDKKKKSTKTKKVKPKKYYAIKNGRKCGVIVRTWGECKELVHGYPKPVYKSFYKEEEAREFLKIGYSKKNQEEDDTKVKVKTRSRGKTIKITITNQETYQKFIEICKNQNVEIETQIERLMKELTDMY